MIRITCYVRPHRLEVVKSAIAALGASGMTISDVRGTGNSREETSWVGGASAIVAMPIRCRVEAVIPDVMLEDALASIREAADTGQHDDGKVFVEAVADAVRIRTGERGDLAI